MNEQFIDAGANFEWLDWLGQPMLYDGGLCVNRTLEEMLEHNKHPRARLMI